MAETEGISLDKFRVLVERAGLTLTATELDALKSMYDLYVIPLALLHEVELQMEDLAVAFSPTWDLQR